MQRQAVLDRFRDARFSDGLFCPRCGHQKVQRWGTFSGRQRYRCEGCRRTFSDLTGTPAAYLKKIELLPSYCDALAAQLSVRRCAVQLGIHPSTAFRWRHRLLDGLRARDTDTVGGWVELGSFWLPESRKGERRRHDEPHDLEGGGSTARRRGSRDRWNLFYDGPRQHVVVACDRRGRVVSAPCPRPHPTRGSLTSWALEAALEGRIDGGPPLNLMASRPARSAAIPFAFRIGATYHDPFTDSRRLLRGMRGAESGTRTAVRSRIRSRPGARSLVHVRTVTSYIRRFSAWLRIFRGVATRYLPNYLLWHRRVDADACNGFQSLLLRWPNRTIEYLPK